MKRRLLTPSVKNARITERAKSERSYQDRLVDQMREYMLPEHQSRALLWTDLGSPDWQLEYLARFGLRAGDYVQYEHFDLIRLRVLGESYLRAVDRGQLAGVYGDDPRRFELYVHVAIDVPGFSENRKYLDAAKLQRRDEWTM